MNELIEVPDDLFDTWFICPVLTDGLSRAWFKAVDTVNRLYGARGDLCHPHSVRLRRARAGSSTCLVDLCYENREHFWTNHVYWTQAAVIARLLQMLSGAEPQESGQVASVLVCTPMADSFLMIRQDGGHPRRCWRHRLAMLGGQIHAQELQAWTDGPRIAICRELFETIGQRDTAHIIADLATLVCVVPTTCYLSNDNGQAITIDHHVFVARAPDRATFSSWYNDIRRSIREGVATLVARRNLQSMIDADAVYTAQRATYLAATPSETVRACANDEREDGVIVQNRGSFNFVAGSHVAIATTLADLYIS